jgi:glyoxylase-like metal-dependent hydrolase (beta-lactamase superfamily II)
MIIEQILVTGMAVFCYLIADEKTGDAILIDPAGDFDLINEKIKKHSAKIRYIVNTHGHYDHTSGNEYMLKSTGASLLIHESDFPHLRSFSKDDAAPFNNPGNRKILLLKHNDIIKLGTTSIKVLNTPGHTSGGISLYADGNIFTGDTLFTEGVGRTDLPGGSQKELVKSIIEKILSLPDNTVIWPGHHYGRKPSSTVKEQKKYFGVK